MNTTKFIGCFWSPLKNFVTKLLPFSSLKSLINKTPINGKIEQNYLIQRLQKKSETCFKTFKFDSQVTTNIKASKSTSSETKGKLENKNFDRVPLRRNQNLKKQQKRQKMKRKSGLPLFDYDDGKEISSIKQNSQEQVFLSDEELSILFPTKVYKTKSEINYQNVKKKEKLGEEVESKFKKDKPLKEVRNSVREVKMQRLESFEKPMRLKLQSFKQFTEKIQENDLFSSSENTAQNIHI